MNLVRSPHFIARLTALVLLAFLGALPHAQARPDSASDELPPIVDSTRLRWLEKAARTLRGGQGLAIGEDRAAWLALSPDAAVARLVADPRFGDTLLDFNLSVLGAKPDRLRGPDESLAEIAFAYPQAIGAAQAAMQGGDFLVLLDREQPLFVPPFRDPEPHLPEDKDVPATELRRRMMARIQADLGKMIEWAEAHPAATPREAFSSFANHFNNGDWFYIGAPREFVLQLVKIPGWYGDIFHAGNAGADALARLDLPRALRRVRNINERFFGQFDRWLRAGYSPRSVSDLKSLDLTSLGAGPRISALSYTLGLRLGNSSTNFNRKRGAWALSRFFCDDLTPLNVVAPVEHGRGQHASEPSCRACHSRLDPMSGYFRTLGFGFNDVGDSSKIVFDDLAMAERADYDRAWASESGVREWEIGYIRSASDPALNDYGNSSADFFALLRRAPEVRSCLVRRMFEYVVGEGQAYDGAYLEKLSRKFAERVSRGDSAGAIRETFSQLVLSQAFAEPDPDPDQCYDRFEAAGTADAAPPCRVAHVLRRNCGSCHGSTSPSAGLDLTRWVPLADGSVGFPHLGPTGQAVLRADTFARILDRLSTGDPARAMPLGQYIPTEDRSLLYRWVTDAGASR